MRISRLAVLAVSALLVAGCRDATAPPEAAGGVGLRPDAPPARVTLAHPGPSLATGFRITCEVRRTGVVGCSGNDSTGRPAPQFSPASGSFIQASVSQQGAFGCALRDDGAVACFGTNSGSAATTTFLAHAGGHFTQVGVGEEHTCALRHDGVVQCWGDDTGGRAPDFRVAATGGFTRIAVGTNGACALRGDGVIECWGDSTSGNHPDSVVAATGTFTDVSVSHAHACALRSDGAVECWGDNSGGQAPATVTAAAGTFTAVGAGEFFTCALRSDGAVECWGDNQYGQAPAIRLPPYGVYATIAIGRSHGCGLRTTGRIDCWGGEGAGSYDRSEVIAEYAVITGAAVPGGAIGLEWEATNPGPYDDPFEYYLVRRRMAVGTGWTKWTSVGARYDLVTEFRDTLVVMGAVYQYHVVACNYNHCVTPLRTAPITARLLTPPSAPTAAAFVATSRSSMRITWTDASSDEVSFIVERQQYAFGSWAGWYLVAMLPSGATAFDDTTVTTGERYQHRVQACHSGGCSAWARTNPLYAEVPPAAPHALAASVTVEWTEVTLAWADTADNETRFEVSRRAWNAGAAAWDAWTALPNQAAGAESAVDASVAPDARYQFRVRACNVAGCSRWTTTTVATAAIPAAPTGVALSQDGGDAQVDFVGAVGRHEVQSRLRTSGVWGAWQAAGEVTATVAGPQQVAYVAAAGVRQARVRSCSVAGCSAWAYSSVVAFVP